MLDIGISSGYAIPSSRALKMQEMLDKVSELTAFARGAAVRMTRTIPQNEVHNRMQLCGGGTIKAYNESSGKSTLQIVPDNFFSAANVRAFFFGMYAVANHFSGRVTALFRGGPLHV